MKKKTIPLLVVLLIVSAAICIVVSRPSSTKSTVDLFADEELISNDFGNEPCDSFIDEEVLISDVGTVCTDPIPFQRKYVSVKPPIKDVEVQKIYAKVSTEKPAVISYPRSGTKISVPANAFVDAKGNEIKGNVSIDYREFRDAADFIASGIPMSFSSNDNMNFFKSAGMFEINASQNGQEVFLKPTAKVSVNFASTDNTSDYTFYEFKDSQNKWVPIGQANLSRPMVQSRASWDWEYYDYDGYPRLSDAAEYYLRKPMTINADDTCSFDCRFDNNKYYYNNREKTERPYWKSDIQYDKEFPAIYAGDAGYIRADNLIGINNVVEQKNKEIKFSLKSYSYLHPELSVFHGDDWILIDPISMEEFTQTFAGEKKFSDMRIEQKNIDDFIFYLKGDNGIVSLHAKPMKHWLGIVKQKLNGDTLMRDYSLLLSLRENRFKRKLKWQIVNKYGYDVRIPGAWEKYHHSQTFLLMTTKEKQISDQQWPAYVQEQVKKVNEWAAHREERKAEKLRILNASEATQSNFIRTLSLSGMGIFNCDQVQRVQNPVILRASYKNTNELLLAPTVTYIIDKSMNGVLAYQNFLSSEYNTQRIVFGKNSKNTMIVFDAEGRLAIYYTEQFKQNNFSNNSSFTFEVNEIDSKMTSVADLRQILGI